MRKPRETVISRGSLHTTKAVVMSTPILTQSRLRELLDYDQKTGVFTRLTKTGPRWLPGQPAQMRVSTNGYHQVFIEGKRYAAHRLVWLYTYGAWPVSYLDHINGRRADNRINNLREVTPSENSQNRRSSRHDSTSGLLGVSPRPDGSWRARINVGPTRVSLGNFPTAQLAHAAYLTAKRTYHSTCTI